MQYGLCSNCAKNEYCALSNNSGSCKKFCEEYEIAGLRARPAAIPLPELPDGSFSRVPGLCGNCGNYPKCGFPKPVSGIWHCEEYS